jgi:Thioesterase-like superfamily
MASSTAASLAAATTASRLTSHSYSLDFPSDWAIGTVPNGGFVTSTILRASALHLSTTLASQRQPHCMILHLEFPRRTSVGPATLYITDIKLGRQTSTIHVTLQQDDDRTEVLGYLTFTNLATESGISLPTSWTLTPAPLPVMSFDALRQNKDPNYILVPNRYAFRRAAARFDVFYPRKGINFGIGRGGLDHWLRLNSGERFTDDALGLVADVALQVTEGYADDNEALRDSGLTKEGLGRLWYPTLVLNLEVKKRLHPDGEKWLFTRVQAKRIQSGRMDLEVCILDHTFDLVALSHHVCMILDVKRNQAERGVGKGKL